MVNDQITQTVLDDVFAEMDRQQALAFGGDTETFDKTNTKNDWVGYIVAYAGRAVDKCFRNQREGQSFRENMVKTAALAIAAIRAYDKGYCK
jgi:hypothetical protein